MAGPSNYTSGEMPVEGHNKTFAGFMAGSKWGGGIIILVCLYASLTLAAKFAWPISLVGTFVVGVLYGLALKMKTGWYAMVFALAVLGALISIVIAILN